MLTSRKLLLWLTPFVLGGVLSFIKAVRDRANIPLHTVEVPRVSAVAQSIEALAFSPDGRLLAIADRQMRLRIWNFEKAGYQQQLESRVGGQSNRISWKEPNRLVVGNGSQIVFFDLKGTKPFRSLSRQSDPDLKYTVDKRPLGKRYPPLRDDTLACALSANAKRAAFVRVDGATSVWDIETPKRIFFLKAVNRRNCGIALSLDGRIPRSGESDFQDNELGPGGEASCLGS